MQNKLDLLIEVKMLKINSKKIDDAFILFGLFFLLYQDCPLFNNASLSAYIFLTYVCYKIIMIFTKKKWIYNFDISELLFFGFLLSCFIYSYVAYGGNGVSRIRNGYVGFISCYVAIKLYIQDYGSDGLKFIFKNIFWMFTSIISLVGIIQIIYIYLWKAKWIECLMNALLWRGGNYFLNLPQGGRICMLYGEPSLAGMYFYLLFVTSFVFCLYNRCIKKKILYICFGNVFIIHLLTFSVKFALDTVIFLFVWLTIMGRKKYINKQNLKKITMIVCVSFLVLIALFLVNKTVYQRIPMIINSFDFKTSNGDNSTIVRLEFIYVGLKGFLSNLPFGVGFGNYYMAFREFLIMPVNERALLELSSCLKATAGMLSSYSFYITTLCEGGVLGIGIIANIIYQLVRVKKSFLKVISVCFMFFLLQSELYGCFAGAVILAIINNKENLKYFEVKNEDFNCDTML